MTCTPRPAGSRLYAYYDDSAVKLVKGIKTARSLGFTLAGLGPIAAAYVSGSLDDASQRDLLAAKLDQIDDRERQHAAICFTAAPACRPSAMASRSS